MRVFLIAAVLAVFATPAAASEPEATKQQCADIKFIQKEYLRPDRQNSRLCDCMYHEIEGLTFLYFTIRDSDYAAGKGVVPRGTAHEALDRASKLTNVYNTYCPGAP